MTDFLGNNSALDAGSLELDYDAVPDEDVVSGSPEMGEQVLGEAFGAEVGIWEITPGTVTDTEVEEISVILSGSGTVELLDTGEVLQLSAGTVLRLTDGTKTRWTITETLRKVYIVGSN